MLLKFDKNRGDEEDDDRKLEKVRNGKIDSLLMSIHSAAYKKDEMDKNENFQPKKEPYIQFKFAGKQYSTKTFNEKGNFKEYE